jgi:hypothetical protein
MDEYRARKLEEETFASSAFDMDIEVVLKHGQKERCFWGRPYIIREEDVTRNGHRMTRLAFMLPLKKSGPKTFIALMPPGRTFDNTIRRVSYFQTNRGYNRLMAVILGAMVLFEVIYSVAVLQFPVMGFEAILKPEYFGPMMFLIGGPVWYVLYNLKETRYTYRMVLKCHDPEHEQPSYHFVVPWDCDLKPVDLLWCYSYPPEVLRDATESFAASMNEHYFDMRSTIGYKQLQVNKMSKDRERERIQRENQGALVGTQRQRMSDNPIVWYLAIGLFGALAAIAYLVMHFTGGA